MALSNILREPRREITESVIGIIVVCSLIVGDYQFAAWMDRTASPSGDSHGTRIVLGMIAGAFVMLACTMLLFVTHALGDAVCNSLARMGFDPRPRRRY